MNDLDIIGFFQGHAWGILTFTLHEAASWIIRIAALCVVPLRHEPSTATVWLLVIFFWPIPGAIIYLLMGSRMLPAKKLERRHTMLAHLKGIREGIVTGTARPLHVGRSTQVWEIRIEDENGQLACVSRLTLAVIRRRA